MLYEFTENEILVYKLRTYGHTFTSICDRISVSPGRARQIYINYKKKDRYNKAVEDFLKNGESVELIAVKYELPITTVNSLIKRQQWQNTLLNQSKGDEFDEQN